MTEAVLPFQSGDLLPAGTAAHLGGRGRHRDRRRTGQQRARRGWRRIADPGACADLRRRHQNRWLGELLISLGVVLVGLWRYWRVDAIPCGRGCSKPRWRQARSLAPRPAGSKRKKLGEGTQSRHAGPIYRNSAVSKTGRASDSTTLPSPSRVVPYGADPVGENATKENKNKEIAEKSTRSLSSLSRSRLFPCAFRHGERSLLCEQCQRLSQSVSLSTTTTAPATAGTAARAAAQARDKPGNTRCSCDARAWRGCDESVHAWEAPP
jgi:hypothetical protein